MVQCAHEILETAMPQSVRAWLTARGPQHHTGLLCVCSLSYVGSVVQPM